MESLLDSALIAAAQVSAPPSGSAQDKDRFPILENVVRGPAGEYPDRGVVDDEYKVPHDGARVTRPQRPWNLTTRSANIADMSRRRAEP